MISKELLSEVLDINKAEELFIKNMTMLGTNLAFETSYGYDKINIYELAHKCKEWAVLQGFEIESRVGTFNKASVAVWDTRERKCATRLDHLGHTIHKFTY